MAFVVAEVLLLLAVPVLAVVGFRAVLDTTGGQVLDPELDPTRPGYEAVVTPTPVALVVGTTAEGALDWVTVLARPGGEGEGGDVLFLPRGTLDEPGSATLADTFSAGGPDGVAGAVGALLATSFLDVVVVDPARLTGLLGPVSPLVVDTADDVVGPGEDGEPVVLFPAGPVTLPAGSAAAFLSGPGPDESDLARLVRHEAFWRAWLGAVAASGDPGAVPGETDAGISPYVRALAAGTTLYDVAPVLPVPPPEGAEGGERFAADVAALRALVDERVPFPAAVVPGARVRVRVLDGVGEPGLAVASARAAVRGIGAEITVVGNADRFSDGPSRVVWIDEPARPAAERLAASLGVDEVVRVEGPNPFDDVDVTLVVGEDLATAYRADGRVPSESVPDPAGGDDPG